MELNNFLQNVIELVRNHGRHWEHSTESWLTIYDDSGIAWHLVLCSMLDKISVHTVDQKESVLYVFQYTSPSSSFRSSPLGRSMVTNVDLFLRFQKLIKKQIKK